MTDFYNKMNLFKYNNLKSDHNQTNQKKIRHSLIFYKQTLAFDTIKRTSLPLLPVDSCKKKKSKALIEAIGATVAVGGRKTRRLTCT